MKSTSGVANDEIFSVKENDTFYKLAEYYSTNVNMIKKANPDAKVVAGAMLVFFLGR